MFDVSFGISTMNRINPSTVESRRQAVREERGSAALEGIKETPLMRSLTEKYVSGQLTIEQALKKTREYYDLEP